MRSLRAIAALVVFAGMVGCVFSQPKLSTTAVPSSKVGYVGAIASRDTVVRFGFGLRDASDREYVLQLDDGVSLIELPPGVYRVAYWVTWALDGERFTQQDIPVSRAVGFPFEVAAGKVMMLGRWFADRIVYYGGNQFTLRSTRLSTQDAAAAVRQRYRGFAGAPIECLVCVR